jgi:hypothetical protein
MQVENALRTAPAVETPQRGIDSIADLIVAVSQGPSKRGEGCQQPLPVRERWTP